MFYIPELCRIAGSTKNDNAKISMLAKLISAQSTDADHRFAFASVVKPGTLLMSMATDCWFESPLWTAHHCELCRPPCTPVFITFATIPFSPVTLVSVECTTS